MFLGRVGQFLGLQLLQGADNAETRVARFDNIIDIAILGCIVRIGKQFGIFSFFFSQELSRIFLLFGLACLQNFYRTCTTHNCDFSSRPCIVHVTTKLLTAHYDVRTAIGFA